MSVTVNQTLTSLAVTPMAVNVNESASTPFTAIGKDQFGLSMVPTPLSWSVKSGGAGGAINSTSGSYVAPSAVVGTDAVVATSGSADRYGDRYRQSGANPSFLRGPTVASLRVTRSVRRLSSTCSG